MLSKTYQDLLDEIQYYNKRIFQLECERNTISKHTWRGPAGYRTNTGIEPTGIRGSNYLIPLDESEIRTEKIGKLITDCEWMLDILLDQLADINQLLYKLEGRQYKIFYLHKCENKPFNEIAKEIGISSKQVQRIYKEVAGDE